MPCFGSYNSAWFGNSSSNRQTLGKKKKKVREEEAHKHSGL